MNAGAGHSINGLRTLADQFDALLIDQYGVLHDGSACYPGARDALIGLRRMNKRVVVLSNSGKRASLNAARLARLGIEAELYHAVLTSGELAWSHIGAEAGRVGNQGPLRCLLLARDDDHSAVDGLDITLVEDPEQAQLVLIAGSTGDQHDEAHFRELLAPAAKRGVQAICSNPDMKMLTAAGVRFGAGRIARIYQELGGLVTWYGKPYPEMYDWAITELGHPAPSRVLCIGDSLEHDIAGGAGAGLKTLFVQGGIHAGVPVEALSSLAQQACACPDYRMSRLIW